MPPTATVHDDGVAGAHRRHHIAEALGEKREVFGSTAEVVLGAPVVEGDPEAAIRIGARERPQHRAFALELAPEGELLRGDTENLGHVLKVLDFRHGLIAAPFRDRRLRYADAARKLPHRNAGAPEL